MPADGAYSDDIIQQFRSLLDTLPMVRQYATFRGGVLLRQPPHSYYAVLMPPVDRAWMRLQAYLAETFDGRWDITSEGRHHDLEVIQLRPPWHHLTDTAPASS
jgi:hypothetical protein